MVGGGMTSDAHFIHHHHQSSIITHHCHHEKNTIHCTAYHVFLFSSHSRIDKNHHMKGDGVFFLLFLKLSNYSLPTHSKKNYESILDRVVVVDEYLYSFATIATAAAVDASKGRIMGNYNPTNTISSSPMSSFI